MAIRSAMHQAGAAALSALLRFDPPGLEQRRLPCPCGSAAHYLELRSKPVLTAVGWVELQRPYYLCPDCHQGQFPADRELDVEGTGVPMVRAETEGRAGKRDGQPAHTREAKLGCVFRQTTVDRDGRPVREEGSTTYVGAIETAEEFGLRLYTEAGHRGWARAEKK